MKKLKECTKDIWRDIDMEKIKAIAFILCYIGICSVMDGVDAGTLDYKYAVILAMVCVVGCIAFLCWKKKKSAVSRKYNGQAYNNMHIKNNHYHCTPKDGGVSSAFYRNR